MRILFANQFLLLHSVRASNIYPGRARNKRGSLWGFFWGTHEGLSSVDRLVSLRSDCQPKQLFEDEFPRHYDMFFDLFSAI